MTADTRSPPRGWQLFASYAYPPNELGYCGPPDSGILLSDDAGAEIAAHARGFDGAWPYLEEIAAAAGISDPLDADVVRSYWLGTAGLPRVDGTRLVQHLRRALRGNRQVCWITPTWTAMRVPTTASMSLRCTRGCAS